MKTSRFITLGCLMLAAVAAEAALQSVKVDATQLPLVPAGLRSQGFRSGEVVVVLNVHADGRLGESLVLAASHRALIQPTLDVLQKWRFTPAQQDGQPVMAQLQVRIDFQQNGVVVVNRTVAEIVAAKIAGFSERSFDFVTCSPGEIDRPLAPLATVAPRYATEAYQDGVRGRVKVEFFVDENGDVRMPVVAADTHPYLSTVAVEALRGWKFAPPTRGGQPVQVAAVQEFAFGTTDGS